MFLLYYFYVYLGFIVVFSKMLYYNREKASDYFVRITNFQEVFSLYYESQLQLLRNAFRKCRIQTVIADLSLPADQHPELKHYHSLSQQLDNTRPLQDYIPPLLPETIYRMSDPFGCRYLYFQLPDFPKNTVLVIGPYLNKSPSSREIMEWSENENIAPLQQKNLALFYSSVPILPDHSHIFILLDAFAELLWGDNAYQLQDVSLHTSDFAEPLATQKASSSQEDTLWFMQNVEQRYAYENQLMDAVSKGQLHKADILFSGLSTFSMEQRVADPVANVKNYCIIINTLLRKAAERGGVHPIYIDRTSSDFAMQIEQLRSLDTVSQFLTEMFQTYCRLVRKHAIKNFSPPVQKALIYIDSHLSDNLTLRTLADTLNISGSYLSTLFKKETGQTLTTYINTQRIKYAKHLLDTTKLQVQTVAQHCGILDVQYFSKLFKSITGTSPKHYRQTRPR